MSWSDLGFRLSVFAALATVLGCWLWIAWQLQWLLLEWVTQ